MTDEKQLVKASDNLKVDVIKKLDKDNPAFQIFADKIDQMAMAMPLEMQNRFFSIAISILNAGGDVGECSPASKVRALLTCANLNLIPDPKLGHAWPIAIRGELEIWVGYKGRIDIARRSGNISVVRPGIVWNQDECDYNEVNGRPVFSVQPYWLIGTDKPNLEEIDDIKFAYVRSIINGDEDVVIASKDEILLSRKRSKGGFGWKRFGSGMALTVPIRKAWKTWPQTPQMAILEDYEQRLEASVETGVPMDEIPEGQAPIADLAKHDEPEWGWSSQETTENQKRVDPVSR